jgi:hypothetical protein
MVKGPEELGNNSSRLNNNDDGFRQLERRGPE